MEPNISSPTSGNGSDKTTTTTTGTSTAAAMGAPSARSSYGETRGTGQRSSATLRSELTNLKNDLDSLVGRAASMSDDELSQAHAQLMAKFSSVRYAAKGIATQATHHINRGMETTTEYVKDKPMQSMAVAAGAGLLLGLLLKRS